MIGKCQLICALNADNDTLELKDIKAGRHLWPYIENGFIVEGY